MLLATFRLCSGSFLPTGRPCFAPFPISPSIWAFLAPRPISLMTLTANRKAMETSHWSVMAWGTEKGRLAPCV
ncbi:hypothetical protein B0T21DRAFT_376108 [Apiosordaria backusii]|uniref:Uncharacterized protein n=1 Tax=Apiosordaria backusii TaxID=314023 RepID=A0AA40DUE1_9PEZI|nr:hypothetical protein B0T21DRAFT_376108 [Apiosordaria backusii]